MVDNKYDIVGIGNSIVDVITDVEDQFLNEHELRKGLFSIRAHSKIDPLRL